MAVPTVLDVELVAANDASLEHLKTHPRLGALVGVARPADVLAWIRSILEAAHKARLQVGAE